MRSQFIFFDTYTVRFFNNIRLDILLKLPQRRISDPRLLKLIRGRLEAGVMEDVEYIESNRVGILQGGVISTFLSNIYLYAFNKMYHISRIPGARIRDCDDFVILLRKDVKQVLEKVHQMLDLFGLMLYPDKT